MQRNLLVIRRNLETAVCYFSGVAKKVAEGAARPGCHHFMVPIEQKATICLILEMFNTLEWTKNDLKNLLKHIFS